jgi:hypothetical protein
LKRIFQIAFVFVFTLITVGITVNKHYSKGELFSIAIFSEPESCCAHPCNCCDEESETIQFLVDYTFSIDNFDPAPGEVELFTVAVSINIAEPELILTDSELFDQDLPPPDKLTTLSFFQNFLL